MNLEPVEGLEDNNKNMYEVGDIDRKTREINYEILMGNWLARLLLLFLII
jgi:hypothetical protein